MKKNKIVGIALALFLAMNIGFPAIRLSICLEVYGTITDSKRVFRLLALESLADSTRMKDGQYLIRALLNYSNWNNGTGFTSYIKLLSLYNQSEIFEECKPFYCGSATKNNLQHEITTFLASASKDEVVVFYYSGHGDIEGLYLDQHINPNELVSWLGTGGLMSTTLCIVLDACYSGWWINDGKEPGGILGSNRLVMTSSNSSQKSYSLLDDGWSFFTGNEKIIYGNGTVLPIGLIGSLIAAHDNNKDGWLSMEEAFEFARLSVEQWMSFRPNKQNPKIYNGLPDKYDPPLILRTPPKPPIADFTYSPEKPWVDETIIFDATASYSPEGNITSYQWSFDDGNVTTITEPIINHTYKQPGKYTMTLKVTDNNILWNTTSRIITVYYITDLNKDGTVDILDIAIVAKAYGTRPGDKNWNSIADLDKSGEIDILDIATVAKDYGKTA